MGGGGDGEYRVPFVLAVACGAPCSVAAVNAGGASPSSTISVTPAAPPTPGAPSGVHGTGVGPAWVSLAWTPPAGASPIVGYAVYVREAATHIHSHSHVFFLNEEFSEQGQGGGRGGGRMRGQGVGRVVHLLLAASCGSDTPAT